MNRVVVLSLLASVGLFSNCLPVEGADRISLQFEKKSESQGEVALHSQMALPVSAMYPEYTIQWSTNMQTWQTLADPISGGIGVSDEQLRVAVPLMGDNEGVAVKVQTCLAVGPSLEPGRPAETSGLQQHDAGVAEFARGTRGMGPYAGTESRGGDPRTAPGAGGGGAG